MGLKEGCKVFVPELKHCWIAHENGEYKYQRYIIESFEDLYKFIDHEQFEHIKKVNGVVKNWIKYIEQGLSLIVSDNTISGYPSYHTSLGKKILEKVNTV